MAEAATKEPSMEDILSSIRKIIADDGAPTQKETPTRQAPQDQQPNNQTPQGGTPDSSEQQSPEPSARQAVSPASSTGQEARATSDAERQPAELSRPVSGYTPTQREEAPVNREQTSAPAGSADDPSSGSGGASAARLAGSLAGVADTVRSRTAYETQSASVERQPAPQPVVERITTPEASLASLRQAAEQPPLHQPATLREPARQETPISKVEMAEAQPAPQAREEVPALASAVEKNAPETASEATSEEEAAFKGALMSPSSDGAVSSAFDRLKRSTLGDLDAKTEAILRPMLREWLDENLPKMVERLVREEIERVARGS